MEQASKRLADWVEPSKLPDIYERLVQYVEEHRKQDLILSFCATCAACVHDSQIKFAAKKDFQESYITQVDAYEFPHHRTLQDLLDATKMNCAMCLLFYRALREAHHAYMRSFVSKHGETMMKCTIHCGKETSDSSIIKLLIYLQFKEGTHASGLPLLANNQSRHQRLLHLVPKSLDDLAQSSFPHRWLDNPLQIHGSNTGSAEALRCASRWLKVCRETHSICQQYHERPIWYPTRLLSIEGQEGNRRIRVISTKEQSPDGAPYITLSHRWPMDSASILKLEPGTKDRLNRGVPCSDLSPIFQDAIAVCVSMNVQFIWIDCLCIIQNDPGGRDFEQEAPLMGDVYMHGVCNIAATDTVDNPGIFRERDPRTIGPKLVQLAETSSSGGEVYLTSNDFRGPGTDFNKDWDLRVEQAPLQKRGWVVQERACAPSELRATEEFPVGKIPDPPDEDTLDEDIDHRDLFQNWNNIVRSYSATELTRPADRLIAFTGAGKRFEQLLQDSYILGVWKDRPRAGLAWHSLNSENSMQPFKWQAYAPSFSWLSNGCSIIPGKEPENQYCFDVLDFSVQWHSENFNLMSASVILQGTLLDVQFEQDTIVHKNSLLLPWHVVLEGYTIPSSIVADHHDRDLFRSNPGATHHLLLIQQGESVGNSTQKWMILEALPDKPDVFRRIGIITTFEKYLTKGPWLKWWRQYRHPEPGSKVKDYGYHFQGEQPKTVVLR